MTLNKENMRLWIAALRSGRYEQAFGALMIHQGDNRFSYCCLGVACVTAIDNGVPVKVTITEESNFFDTQRNALPERVQKWLGLDSFDPDVHGSDWVSCIDANDGRRWNFNQIADGLERRYLYDDYRARQLINARVAACVGQKPHVWRKTRLQGCETCGDHDGFECVQCGRCADRHLDTDIYEAIMVIGYQEEEDGH